MEEKTRELAEKALNDLLETMSHYAKERPYDTEVICALSSAIAAVSNTISRQSIQNASKQDERGCEGKRIRGAKL